MPVRLFALAITASAAPVTEWSVGLGSPTLSGAGTSSPALGNNTADNADNTAMHGAFPAITLALGDRLTLSGSMQLFTGLGATPTALAAEFRFGLFNQNASPALTNWLGYYATAPSGATAAGARRKNSSTAAYYSSGGASLLYANSLTDTSKTFEDTTYDFTLSLERTVGGIRVSATIDNALGYALTAQSFEDLSANTFTFDRVGFLSGGNMNADQLNFTDLEVNLTPVPEPSSIALLALGALALVRIRSKR